MPTTKARRSRLAAGAALGAPPLMRGRDPRANGWKVLDRSTVLEDAPWIRVERQQIRFPGGRTIPNFYQIRLPDFSLVAARTGPERFLVAREYKHALGDLVLGFPGGFLEPGEDPLAAAQRELREETGYEAKTWRSLGSFMVDANRGCGTAHLFEARTARRMHDPTPDESEYIELHEMSRDAIRQALRQGRFTAMAAALAASLIASPDANAKRAPTR